MLRRALLVFLLLTRWSWSHGIDDAVLQLTQDQHGWKGVWRAPLAIFANCDHNHDGEYSRSELSADWTSLCQGKFRLIDPAGQAAAPELSEGTLEQSPAQLVLPIRFHTLPSPTLTLEYQMYSTRLPNPQCVAVLTNTLGESKTLLLNPANPRQTLHWSLRLASPEAVSSQSTMVRFFSMGVGHILTGYDHLLFLLTLVIVGGTLGRWIQVITAFSVAHSISLALAVFGIVYLSPRIIEPIIALSITVAAIQAARGVAAQRLEGGWQLAFGFGLIHGLGFAGVLQELQLSGQQALVPLVGFNLGVEAGQLCVAALLLPLIRWLCKSPWGTSVRRWTALLAGGLGLYWFITRLAVHGAPRICFP